VFPYKKNLLKFFLSLSLSLFFASFFSLSFLQKRKRKRKERSFLHQKKSLRKKFLAGIFFFR